MSNRSIEMLQTVADGLGDLNEAVVFVGGATAGLYVTNPGAPEPRPTLDVDCVVEAASYAELSTLESRLRSLEFKNDKREGAPICRWIYRGITVDVMPQDSGILGFTNRWYEDGIRHAVERVLLNAKRIKVFSAPYFVASKIEAYLSRGNNEMRTSADFEDLIYVLDNRGGIVAELADAEATLRAFVDQFIDELLRNADSDEGITAVLPYGSGDAGVQRIKRIMREILSHS